MERERERERERKVKGNIKKEHKTQTREGEEKMCLLDNRVK